MEKTEIKKTVRDLSPSPYNPRKITSEKLRMLGKSMKEFGDLSGIVFNIRTGRLIGGHQRIKHLDPSWQITKREHMDKTGTIALGEIETPFGVWQYREVDWLEKKEIAANIAANHQGGYDDLPKLKSLLIEIDDGETDMELAGFNESELERLIVGEEEIQEAGRTAEEIIESLKAKINLIAKENPKRLNSALAVLVQNGRGNKVLFLADPNTADIVKELRRYAESGEHSPLECLMRSLI
jgi:hypothetical protein